MFRVARRWLAIGSISVCFALSCFARSAQGQSSEPSPAQPAQSSTPGAQSQNTAASSVAASSAVQAKSTPAASNDLSEGLSLYRARNFNAASEKYLHALQENPNLPDAYVGLARVYLKQGKVNLASETVAKGQTFVNSPRLHVALGEVYFRQGRIGEAEQEWVKVINSGNPDPRAYLGVARVRNALSMYKKGKAMIDKAHELDRDDPEIESDWIRTLPISERIQNLERSLAASKDNGDQEQADAQRYLEYLRALQEQPRNNCRLVNNLAATETPLVRLMIDPTHLRGYGLAVDVNGRKANLMLDTGASGILVDRGIAEKAGITRMAESRISGIGDQEGGRGYIGLASSIKIGELEFRDCPVEVLEKRSVVGEAGLIGADVFEDFLVNIDFPKEKLRLSQLPKPPEEAGSESLIGLRTGGDSASAEGSVARSEPKAGKPSSAPASLIFHDPYIAPEMKNYSRIFRFGHELLVPTKVGNAPIKLFLVDTGALLNQITPDAAREVTKVHGDSDMIIHGLSGSVKNVYSADKAILQFGHLKQENQDLVAFDLTSFSESTGTEISGTLGFVTLHLLNIKIDYRDGLIDFDYKAAF